ncbi:MAG TPA: hypothetical protein VHG91_21870 [Longimicrobium sp.]|nr:hypothetical protein [Longimicrobium sp.]
MKLPASLARLAACAALLALGACDDPPADPPTPGTLTATVVSPHGAEGAVLLELSGEGVGAVTAPAGQRIFTQGTDPVRVLLVLPQPGQARFSVAVADTKEEPEVDFLEVADGANQLRPSLAGYRVEFGQ